MSVALEQRMKCILRKMTFVSVEKYMFTIFTNQNLSSIYSFTHAPAGIFSTCFVPKILPIIREPTSNSGITRYTIQGFATKEKASAPRVDKNRPVILSPKILAPAIPNKIPGIDAIGIVPIPNSPMVSRPCAMPHPSAYIPQL